MRTQIHVPFEGAGSGTGELSWAQRSMWATISREGQSVTMGGISPLPPGTTEQDAAAGVRFLISRHQSLRTRYQVREDGSACQVLSDSGVFSVDVIEAGDRDPAVVAGEIRDDYQNRNFDYANEWPLRMAVIRSHGVATHVVAIYLHLALDALGLRALLADLATMDPVTGTSPEPPSGTPPIEQARWQQTAAAQRQSHASLRHLERILRSIPIRRFPPPEDLSDEPSYPQFAFRSPATRLAVRRISQRLRIDTSPILLALYGIAVTRLTDNNPFVSILAVSNRFRPGFATSVSQLAQVSPCLIDLADISLDEAIGRARRAAVGAYKYAYYDPAARRELVARIAADRGEKVEMSSFFNDRRLNRDLTAAAPPTDEQIQAALPHSELSWLTDIEEIPEILYLSVDDDDEAVLFELSADSRYLPPDRLEALAYEIEALAVQAAIEPSAPTLVRSAQVPV
ncbi:MAG: condensation domain-containing protein [Jatrophihabitans sp.]